MRMCMHVFDNDGLMNSFEAFEGHASVSELSLRSSSEDECCFFFVERGEAFRFGEDASSLCKLILIFGNSIGCMVACGSVDGLSVQLVYRVVIHFVLSLLLSH